MSDIALGEVLAQMDLVPTDAKLREMPVDRRGALLMRLHDRQRADARSSGTQTEGKVSSIIGISPLAPAGIPLGPPRIPHEAGIDGVAAASRNATRARSPRVAPPKPHREGTRRWSARLKAVTEGQDQLVLPAYASSEARSIADITSTIHYN